MKRYFRLFLTAVIIIMSVVATYAHDFEVDGIYYNKNGYKSVYVTFKGSLYNSYTNEYTGKVEIPSTVTYSNVEYTIQGIGMYAFKECSDVTAVVIPEGAVFIGPEAFWNCTSLHSITVPSSVTTIGRFAFGQTPFYIDHADGLVCINSVLYKYKGEMFPNTPIEVPDNIQHISGYAFDGCTNMASIKLPKGLKTIGNGAFASCEDLKVITIPASLETMGDEAFLHCSDLTTIYYNAVNCGYDGAFSAFYKCPNLSTVIVGDEVETIPMFLFKNCSGITKLVLGSSLRKINGEAFDGCENLTEVNFPEGVAHIESFEECTNLQKITLPESVTYIKGFRECASLHEVTIPKNVTYLNAFSYCEGIEIVNYNAADCDNNESFFRCTNLKTLNIGSSVVTFDQGIGKECPNLKYVNIANGVTELKYYAFRDFVSIERLAIPASVTKIGAYLTENCKNLATITVDEANTVFDSRNDCNAIIETATGILKAGCKNTIIPEGILTIGTGAFRGMTMAQITLPESLAQLNASAFENCAELTEITIPANVKTIKDYVFSGCLKLASLYYNAIECEESSGFCDNNFIKNVYIGDSVKIIPKKFLHKCTGVKQIAIPNGVTKIGASAFKMCSGLASVSLPETLVEIEGSAFYSCSGLTEVAVPERVVKIGSSAFEKCSALVTVSLPNSLTEIGDGAFRSCSVLSELVIPVGVTTIAKELFCGCDKLTSMTIPNGVTTIGSSAFLGCDMLSEITIPASVVEIAISAFSLCKGLTEVTIEASTPPTIYKSTFNKVDKTAVTLYVPVGCKEVYQAAEYWNEFVNIVELESQEVLATSLEIDKASVSVREGEQVLLHAVISPDNASSQVLEWTTSNEAVATVDSTGLVTAVGVGNASIIVSTTDGSNLQDTCEVVVEPVLAEDIALDCDNIAAIVGDTVVLSVSLQPLNVTERNVLWEVSDNTVVDLVPIEALSAQVTILREGVADITVRTIDGSNLCAVCTINIYSGLNHVEVNTGNVVYYDLQGRRVNSTAKGIYIVRGDGGVRKVLIKE